MQGPPFIHRFSSLNLLFPAANFHCLRALRLAAVTVSSIVSAADDPR
jgi:hypothetical protein